MAVVGRAWQLRRRLQRKGEETSESGAREGSERFEVWVGGLGEVRQDGAGGLGGSRARREAGGEAV